jgi:hypothetical protein
LHFYFAVSKNKFPLSPISHLKKVRKTRTTNWDAIWDSGVETGNPMPENPLD